MRESQAETLSPPFISLSSSLLLLIIIALLSYSIPAAQCTAVESGEGDSGGRRRPESVEWETLTKRNFSSQIRANPHLLLMITVPWSGESRSLMKEVSHLVAGKGEKLGYLKLMVVYRNSDKFLADALDASEGITLFYYHHSTSYKYRGRLRAQNILSSVYHFMLLQTEEVPLKPLHTEQDLETFSQSTDKAVFLLDFCGWSAKLLHRRNHGDTQATQTEQKNSVTVEILEQDFSAEAGGEMSFEKMTNQKMEGLESETLTYHVKSGPADSSLLGRRANQTDSQGATYGGDDTDMPCTDENFHKFNSFFWDFMKISRDYFLPPERHRFGLISEKSLLPFLDVGNPDTWLVVVKFSGCLNCSMILHEGDDLRTILQTHHALVKELDADGSLESVFPAKRPSVILFIDRSAGSSKLRGESNSALQILRKFVKDNHLFGQIVRGQDTSSSESARQVFPNTWSQLVTDHSFQHSIKESVTPKLVKFQDNMAIMITNKGKSVALDATADPQGNSLYNMLANLLDQKKPGVGTKETKISLLAKEVGFQLLSDDFGVQLAESSASQIVNEDPRLSYVDDNSVPSLEDQTSTLPQKFNEDCVSSNKVLLDSDSIASGNDEKQSEHPNTGICLQQNQESSIKEFTTILAKELEAGICTSTGTQDNKDDKGCKGVVLQSHTCPAKDLEKESSSLENLVEEKNIDWVDLTDITSGKYLVGNDAVEAIKSTREGSGDWHVEQLPFMDSFFFSDGGYQLLRSLTGGEKIPALVIVDPVSQRHYVYSEEMGISYSSLVSFLQEFLNGNLTPYQRTSSPFTSSRESLRPPFVNQDFHEVDSIPRVTVNTFCELIVGYKPCKMGSESIELSLSQIENFGHVWKTDVLVLFCTSYCGFCQRLELVVREVYRAFKNFTVMLKRESKTFGSHHSQDEDEDTLTNGLPSIFLMDCTMNDCGTYLTPVSKKEHYPELLLFPAENKTAITYKGDMSVVSIIEFLVSHGRNSHHLSRHKGFLWMHTWNGRKNSARFYDESSLAYEGATFARKKYNSIPLNTAEKGDENDLLHVESHRSNNLHSGGHHVVAGSVLAANDMLLNAAPFDNSTILIVMADTAQGFQGVIINKRIEWDVFEELDQQLEPLKMAPLFYGGPIRTHGLPLVSLAQKPMEGYVKITSDIYFGNPLATRLAIEGIQSGEQSASDFWFFLGYSSWQWNQLFDELATGAWYLNETEIGNIDWPDRVKVHLSVL